MTRPAIERTGKVWPPAVADQPGYHARARTIVVGFDADFQSPAASPWKRCCGPPPSSRRALPKAIGAGNEKRKPAPVKYFSPSAWPVRIHLCAALPKSSSASVRSAIRTSSTRIISSADRPIGGMGVSIFRIMSGQPGCAQMYEAKMLGIGFQEKWGIAVGMLIPGRSRFVLPGRKNSQNAVEGFESPAGK